jgi:squalene monooxygenase
MNSTHYDVVIVGAGIAGCAMAHALSNLSSSKSLRICLLERSLSEPDRIVGELLQPGGVRALTKLGMESCLEGIDAVPVKGYCVVHDGKNVQIPYPDGYEGRSFHHGKFVMSLRGKAKAARGVEVLERTVTELIECQHTGRVLGVTGVRKTPGEEDVKETFYADLTVIADGCFSNFRNGVMGSSATKSTVKSHFVGLILEDAKLPYDKHGTVALVKGHGPVLMYRIAQRETRLLVDVKQPLPADLKVRDL